MTLEQLAALAQLPIAVAVAVVLVYLVTKMLAFIREERDAFIAQLTLQQEQHLTSQQARDERYLQSLDSNTAALDKIDDAMRDLSSSMRTWRELGRTGGS